ncbi:MAG: GNAT family N-acetyltransferase [Firmicutes bacterium]|nr:GNAT family N-acetyltransferase [Bacillota bacterium]
MEYAKTITLKDGRECVLRHGTEADGPAAYEIFNLTHEQTDYLLTYPGEGSFTVEGECEFLKAKAESPNAIDVLAEIEGRLVGLAGIAAVGDKEKIRHRAEFGISIDRAYWGLGVGRGLTEACIDCAKTAGYAQLELEAVADNERALALYQKAGFAEYGRNPRGFRTRQGDWQELVLMRLELD